MFRAWGKELQKAGKQLAGEYGASPQEMRTIPDGDIVGFRHVLCNNVRDTHKLTKNVLNFRNGEDSFYSLMMKETITMFDALLKGNVSIDDPQTFKTTYMFLLMVDYYNKVSDPREMAHQGGHITKPDLGFFITKANSVGKEEAKDIMHKIFTQGKIELGAGGYRVTFEGHVLESDKLIEEPNAKVKLAFCETSCIFIEEERPAAAITNAALEAQNAEIQAEMAAQKAEIEAMKAQMAEILAAQKQQNEPQPEAALIHTVEIEGGDETMDGQGALEKGVAVLSSLKPDNPPSYDESARVKEEELLGQVSPDEEA